MERFEAALDPCLRRQLLDRESASRVGDPADRGSRQDRTHLLALLSGDRPPDGFERIRWSRLADRLFLIDATLDEIAALARTPSVKYLEAGRPIGPILDGAVVQGGNGAARAAPLAAAAPTGRNVALGIIDFGLDFTLDSFRREDGGTRIAFLWDQSLTPAANESAPEAFGFGVEYDAAAIDAALGTANPFAHVRHRPSAGSAATHVAGIAASEAPDALLIYVQPRPLPHDSSFTCSSMIAAAISYIFERARELGLPCVITTSLSGNGGSHDGESLFERAIDRQLEIAGRALVVGAGHELIWRGHASGRVAEGLPAVLNWWTGGGPHAACGRTAGGGRDRTPNRMEVWYSSRDRFRLRLSNRGGHETDWIEPGEARRFRLGGYQLFVTSERFTPLNGDSRIYLELVPAPQSPGSGPSGSWKIELEALEARDGRFHAFIERSRRDPANHFADQSLFEEASFDPATTLGAPATCRLAITVTDGGEHTSRGQPGAFASRGRTRDGRGKPELAVRAPVLVAAPEGLGLNEPARPNGNGQTGRPGVTPGLGLSQASLAAPRVAALVARMLEARPDLSAAQIRSRLVAAAAAPAGAEGFDPAWGYGLLDLQAALGMD